MPQEERPIYMAVYVIRKGIVNPTAVSAALENHLDFRLEATTHEPASVSENSELLGVSFSCRPDQPLQEIVQTIKKTLESTYAGWRLSAASLHPMGRADQIPSPQVSMVWLPKITYQVSQNGMITKL